ncbi:DMT family transporter [Paracidovorax cattleyae]|uniref:Permease of the drug/metabolite transporter (DMT) superfamily n=1 Tax=Paracidovorax cattleyae TaxID=80868 RepID=A0A1H0TSN5_9BURK|nr:DMT family transporter [Paracidovorax cattleyae]SDP57102.1 Permease of the drug/metabolite transporter (DMT) superfamily [Paracidovorax cattleyae]
MSAVPAAAAQRPPAPHSAETRGLLWGLLGVAIFAFTLPMTRLAVGTAEAPQLPGAFVAIARAAIAGLLSAALLLAQRAPLPAREDWLPLAATSLGVVFGFPLLTSLAMRHVAAVHASVVIGLLPLATALVGALLHRQRPSARFWLCALAGTALVVAFALRRPEGGGLTLHPADLLLLAAVLCAAVGYGFGGRLSQRMPAGAVICWALVMGLPVALPAAWIVAPPPDAAASVAPAAWAALAYVSVFSMWLGFFAWYRGLALGGTVRVSQVQLVQPFLGMLFAVPLLGERLDAASLGFGLAVMATVLIGRRAPSGQQRGGLPAARAAPGRPPRS